jgi:hypothetical protein
MKLVSVVFVFACALAAVGLACGPEQPYCYEQHKTCEQAKIDRDQSEQDRLATEAAKRADAGVTDTGTIIID